MGQIFLFLRISAEVTITRLLFSLHETYLLMSNISVELSRSASKHLVYDALRRYKVALDTE